MSNITLTSPTFIVSKILRKTSAKVFSDWREGDEVRFHTIMCGVAGASGGGVYASDFTAENTTNGTRVGKSQTNMVNVLRNFELQRKDVLE